MSVNDVHPPFCDFIKGGIQNPKQLPLRKVMLEEYFDDFNSLNRTSYPVGGSYFTLANRPKALRDHSETVRCAGFCPPGLHFPPLSSHSHFF